MNPTTTLQQTYVRIGVFARLSDTFERGRETPLLTAPGNPLIFMLYR